MWSLWPQLPSHGRKAAQFVDLLGFFSIKTLQDEKKIREFVQEAVQVLKSQNTTLATHPNSNIYGSLSQLVEFNGYYLESDPCLVCNNPEVMENLREIDSFDFTSFLAWTFLNFLAHCVN